HAVDGVGFRAAHPLAAGFGGAPLAVFNVPADVGSVSGIRLVGTLSYAFQAAQGQTVAMLSLDAAQTIPIRAGIDLSERAYDRPSIIGLVQHNKAVLALAFEWTTLDGDADS